MAQQKTASEIARELGTDWQVIATGPFDGPVHPTEQNPGAHGGVCYREARRVGGRMQGRFVNGNGKQYENGEPFALTETELAEWLRFERASN